MNNENNTVSCVNYNPRPEWELWTGNNKCPMCDGDDIEYNTMMVLASNPPQTQLRCKSCGHLFSSGLKADWIDEDALNKVWEHTQSILGIPKVGDWPPSHKITDPLPGNMNYGWICPKCGKVNAPHRDFCDCSGGLSPNIIYCNGTGNNPNPVPTVTVSNKEIK